MIPCRPCLAALATVAALLIDAPAGGRAEPAGAASEASKVATRERRDADFERARQKCERFSGDARASCVIIARARFDRI